eukprot:gene4235-8429_t
MIQSESFTISQHQDLQLAEIKHIISHLLLAFKLPKTFKEFRDLDEEKNQVFFEIGIDGTSTRKYRPFDCQKMLLGITRLRSELISYCNPQSKEEFHEEIFPICTAFLNYLVEENKTIKGIERITKLAQEQGLVIEEIEGNPAKGANPSFTAIVEGKKYYIKTCSNDPYLQTLKTALIQMKTSFVYKLMEYMGFGPQTMFLMGIFSSTAGGSSNSSISCCHFIMTENLNQYNNHFFLDIEDYHEEFQRALNDGGFTIELSAASVLNDILSLTDTFGRNGCNYGLLMKSDGTYTIQFVDHIPNANNGLFSSSMRYDPVSYSPRDTLQKKSIQFGEEKYSAFKDLKLNRQTFLKISIQYEVGTRLAGLSDAIERAVTDVRSLMECCIENFTDEADLRQAAYIEKIKRNTVFYSRSTCVPPSESKCSAAIITSIFNELMNYFRDNSRYYRVDSVVYSLIKIYQRLKFHDEIIQQVQFIMLGERGFVKSISKAPMISAPGMIELTYMIYTIKTFSPEKGLIMA